MDHIYRLQSIFRDIFDNSELRLTEATSMANCPEWDSVATVQIVLAIESEYDFRFKTDEVAGIRSVADILRLLEVYHL